jgi:hypothetical protein
MRPMVEQLREYVNALLSNYIDGLDVRLPQPEHAWLLNDIVSQMDLAAHNMVREALVGLGYVEPKAVEQSAKIGPIRKESKASCVPDDLTVMRERLRRLQDELHRALDAAHGRQQDAVVQRVAKEFDEVMGAYMKLRSRRGVSVHRDR